MVLNSVYQHQSSFLFVPIMLFVFSVDSYLFLHIIWSEITTFYYLYEKDLHEYRLLLSVKNVLSHYYLLFWNFTVYIELWISNVIRYIRKTEHTVDAVQERMLFWMDYYSLLIHKSIQFTNWSYVRALIVSATFFFLHITYLFVSK